MKLTPHLVIVYCILRILKQHKIKRFIRTFGPLCFDDSIHSCPSSRQYDFDRGIPCTVISSDRRETGRISFSVPLGFVKLSICVSTMLKLYTGNRCLQDSFFHLSCICDSNCATIKRETEEKNTKKKTHTRLFTHFLRASEVVSGSLLLSVYSSSKRSKYV